MTCKSRLRYPLGAISGGGAGMSPVAAIVPLARLSNNLSLPESRGLAPESRRLPGES